VGATDFSRIAKKTFAPTTGALMSDLTQLLERIDNGDRRATDELLPIVYRELRRLASKQLASETAGQSLQSADLVHEAYLRLLGGKQEWDGCGHFFAAAAEAMRRILVERARKKRRIKHGGEFTRLELSDESASSGPSPDEVIEVSELLESLANGHAQAAQIVKLHYFAGLNISEAARALGITGSMAHRQWNFARAWLREAVRSGAAGSGKG
jgi:RNA polymerase sigma factor (TIGR02999 family)